MWWLQGEMGAVEKVKVKRVKPSTLQETQSAHFWLVPICEMANSPQDEKWEKEDEQPCGSLTAMRSTLLTKMNPVT